MKIINYNDKIILYFLPKNDGKFRFKIRFNNFSFGESFATTTKPFTDKVYLEWQIGYDALIKDTIVGKDEKKSKKHTSLTNISFKGFNKKDKYLYELSEIFFFLFKNNIISSNFIEDLIKEIKSYKEFISDKDIFIEKDLINVIINNIDFKETTTSLPTFFYYPKTGATQIEVFIQKQQYATGVQPMVYYSIPVKSFKNGENIIGKTYKDLKDKVELEYVIDKSNASNFIDLIKIFGMCSPAHNFDILEILNSILKYR